jgi:hypothetical protein
MSPIFDENFTIKNDVVIYGHSDVRPLKDEAEKLGLPYLDNTTPTGLREVLEFLASGNTVITSSYHGAYWATLLGRRVAMLPFGTKFYSLKHRPPVADNIPSGLKVASTFNGVLDECREINQAFAQRVQAFLDERGK